MADLKVVAEFRPPGCDEVAEVLRALADRAAAGEFQSVMYYLFRPDGCWLSGKRGEPIDALKLIGLFEVAKSDVVASVEPDEGSIDSQA